MTQKFYAILALFLLGGIENNAYALIQISNDTSDSIKVTLKPDAGKHLGCKDKVVSLTPNQKDKHVYYHSEGCKLAPINTISIEGPKGTQIVEIAGSSGFGVFGDSQIYIKPGGWTECLNGKKMKVSYKIDGISNSDYYYQGC